jgi:hypothetical protein
MTAFRSLMHVAISWFIAFALLHGTLIPFAPALRAGQAGRILPPEIENTLIVLGVSADASGFLCHDGGSDPASPGDGDQYPDKGKCPICQAAQHLAFGLPPAEFFETPFAQLNARVTHFASAAILHTHELRSGRPRAPPASFENSIV